MNVRSSNLKIYDKRGSTHYLKKMKTSAIKNISRLRLLSLFFDKLAGVQKPKKKNNVPFFTTVHAF
jgi:hypothetical protein